MQGHACIYVEMLCGERRDEIEAEKGAGCHPPLPPRTNNALFARLRCGFEFRAGQLFDWFLESVC